jgi:hypothetical protein
MAKMSKINTRVLKKGGSRDNDDQVFSQESHSWVDHSLI